jgi:hypothetical protein
MQRLSSVLASALLVGIVTGLSVRPAQASEFDKLTYLTFSGPVEIPGVGLAAGTYIFELANPDSGSHVVRVLSRDRKTVYATFFALPDSRRSASGETIVTFHEELAGAPQAIKTWFYPGETTGFEFVYPKAQVMRLASATPSVDTIASTLDAK